MDLVTSSDEVARKAYFTYVNQGSQPGHEVQHWLAAEAELIEERTLTRTHGFHNKTYITLAPGCLGFRGRAPLSRP